MHILLHLSGLKYCGVHCFVSAVAEFALLWRCLAIVSEVIGSKLPGVTVTGVSWALLLELNIGSNVYQCDSPSPDLAYISALSY